MNRARLFLFTLAVGVFTVAMAPASSIRDAAAKTVTTASKWQATLSGDGGAAGTSYNSAAYSVTLQKFSVISLETQTGDLYCYKTCPTSACLADCTKDKTANRTRVNLSTPDSGLYEGRWEYQAADFNSGPIQMGHDVVVSVMNPDGGNPAVRLYLETKNP